MAIAIEILSRIDPHQISSIKNTAETCTTHRKSLSLHRNFNRKEHNYGRPIRETPVLKGEDAFNFEMRRLEVEHMSKEQRAENRRKLEERIANAKNKIEWCW